MGEFITVKCRYCPHEFRTIKREDDTYICYTCYSKKLEDIQRLKDELRVKLPGTKIGLTV